MGGVMDRLHPATGDGTQFPCGTICEKTVELVIIRSVTSFFCILYGLFLCWKRSRDPAFMRIRIGIITYMVFRTMHAIAPSTVVYTTIIGSIQQISLFFAVFEWHKAVVDSSYKAVKVSLTSPRWNIYYTRGVQVLLFIMFPLTLGLGATPTGGPRCSIIQATNRVYRLAMVISLGFTFGFCNFIVHNAVKRLREQNKVSGGNEGMQRRFKAALTKIRKIVITIMVVVVVNTYSFASSFGATEATCFRLSSDLLGGLSGAIGGLLILWATDSVGRAAGSTAATQGTKSISDSHEPSKPERTKTYSEVQADKARAASRASRTSTGFARPASTGFAQPVQTQSYAANPNPMPTQGFSQPQPVETEMAQQGREPAEV